MTYLREALIFLIKLLLFYYSNWKALQTKLIAQDYEDPEFIENIQNSYLLKILFKHFKVLAVLSSLPLDLNSFIDTTFEMAVSLNPK